MGNGNNKVYNPGSKWGCCCSFFLFQYMAFWPQIVLSCPQIQHEHLSAKVIAIVSVSERHNCTKCLFLQRTQHDEQKWKGKNFQLSLFRRVEFKYSTHCLKIIATCVCNSEIYDNYTAQVRFISVSQVTHWMQPCFGEKVEMQSWFSFYRSMRQSESCSSWGTKGKCNVFKQNFYGSYFSLS